MTYEMSLHPIRRILDESSIKTPVLSYESSAKKSKISVVDKLLFPKINVCQKNICEGYL